jgi:hypothetical protein
VRDGERGRERRRKRERGRTLVTNKTYIVDLFSCLLRDKALMNERKGPSTFGGKNSG